MIRSIAVAIGLIAMAAIIATSRIAIQTIQPIEAEPGNGGDGGGFWWNTCTTLPAVPDTAAIKNAENHATAEYLKQTST